jgi:hypothetical protein
VIKDPGEKIDNSFTEGVILPQIKNKFE